MAQPVAFDDIATIIQLSVAPVFLLVAIGSMLGVVTSRLGRVIDRARDLEARLLAGTCSSKEEPFLVNELRVLDRRMTVCHWAINFCSVAALIIAIMVAVLFISYLTKMTASFAAAVLFILAMAGIVLGLCFFLAEIYMATKTVHVRSELLKSYKKSA